jgi:CubicO group peptidase (beta-lactamase class C family)
MSRRLVLLALAATCLAEPAAAAAPASLEAAVDAIMAGKGIGPRTAPGCAISVVQAGKTLIAKGYGAADLEHGAAFTPDTVSETGSVAKQFTAAAVLMLAEEGRLSLDDDIRKYLPEMPDYGTPIRIRDLIHQTSGVREWATLAALSGRPRFFRKLYTNDDLLRFVTAQRALNFTPGARYEYSNSNYGLLTVIVGRVSGMSAAEFGRRRLFAPLGMTATAWRDDARRTVAGRATAYRPRAPGFETFMPNESVYGHGAALTTVGDLQRWNAALHGGKLSPFVTREMLAPGRLSNGETRPYAGGILIGDHRGHRAYRHGGNTAGYSAQLWALPDDGLSVALLCNARTAEADIVARTTDAVLGLPAEPKAAGTVARTPTGPVAYYRSEGGEMVGVRRDSDGTAFVDLFAGPGPVRLGDLGGPEVALKGEEMFVRFEPTRDAIRFRHIAPALAETPIEGLYRSADIRAAYRVRRWRSGYRLELAEPGADIALAFRLERLTGDAYLARVEPNDHFRDNLFATFSAEGMTLSSVVGLQAVDNLAFERVP